MTHSPGQFPLVWDATMRRAFASCPLSFKRSYIDCIALDTGPSIHLHAGAQFAKGCEITRKQYYSGLASSTREALVEGQRALISGWGPEQFDAEAKSLWRTSGALTHYFETYPLETETLRPVDLPNGPAIEVNFALPLDINHPVSGDPIIYCGRFDMLAEMGGTVFVVDEKTTSSLGASWHNKWDLRSQFTGYCWGAQSFGHPVAGAIVRGISILKTTYDTAEAITYRPQWMIERWYEQLLWDISMAKKYWQENQWPANLDESCTQYGGCQFQRLCTTEDPQPLISIYYKQHIWNPLHIEDS